MSNSLSLRSCFGAGVIIVCWHALSMGQPRNAPRPTTPPPPQPCASGPDVATRLRVHGFEVAGFNVQIDASSSKIVFTNDRCITRLAPFNSFQWDLVARPSRSNASLTETRTFKPNLFLDVIGDYRIRFTACPTGCSAFGQSVDAVSEEVVVTAQSDLVIPPETVPILPSSATTPDTRTPTDGRAKCGFGPGDGENPFFLQSPEWVTVNSFKGPEDYQTLEGWVAWSRASDEDNELNHSSHDVDFFVLPDPRLTHLLPADLSQPGVEVEWERNEIREFNWPSFGDRVSIFGYWVHDCGHAPFDLEIHPPVGVVVQRARPILIPKERQFTFTPCSPESKLPCPAVQNSLGTDVIVPGIVSDIFFSRHGGDLKESCDTTTLHQPAQPVPIHPIPGPCIGGSSSLNRTFEFNIYLPTDPRIVQARLGRTVNRVQIYHEVLPGSGPEPQIQEVREGDVQFLHVTLDLRGFEGEMYSRRMVAGWALPSPDNWGLRAWRLSVSSLTIHDSGDVTGDGDWRLWVNTNNANHEWTRVLDCESCINEGEVTGLPSLLGRAPWETGPTGVLGPDILLFPKQGIQVHASAYETDLALDDDRGIVMLTQPQEARSYRTRSCCGDNSAFTLNYSIAPGPPVPRPALTAEAQALFDNYRITGPQSSLAFTEPASSAVVNPISDLALQPGSPALDLNSTVTFRRKEREGLNAFVDAGVLQQRLAASQVGSAAFTDLLNQLSTNFVAGLGSGFRKDYLSFLPIILPQLKQALPADQYAAKFARVGTILNLSGDVNGDGVIDRDDLARLDLAISGERVLSPEEGVRADIGACGEMTRAALEEKRRLISSFLQSPGALSRGNRRSTRPTDGVPDPCHSGVLVGTPIAK
jgi:hypothetical protein